MARGETSCWCCAVRPGTKGLNLPREQLRSGCRAGAVRAELPRDAGTAAQTPAEHSCMAPLVGFGLERGWAQLLENTSSCSLPPAFPAGCCRLCFPAGLLAALCCSRVPAQGLCRAYFSEFPSIHFPFQAGNSELLMQEPSAKKLLHGKLPPGRVRRSTVHYPLYKQVWVILKSSLEIC